MLDTNDSPAWVRVLGERRLARGTSTPESSPLQPIREPEFARGSMPSVQLITEPTRVVGARLPLERWLFLASLAAVAVTVTVVGTRMWRSARTKHVAIPSAVTAIGDGRLELSADRRTLVRLDRGGTRWSSPQPAAVDSLEVTGPLVLAYTSGAFTAIDLESGAKRFASMLPAGEAWGAQRPVVLGSCLTAITLRGDDAFARCLDVVTGDVHWNAKIASGRECVQPPVQIPGAYLVQCPGWTTVIDDRNGNVSFDAGGIGLVQRDPPMLLRSGSRLALAPWSARTRQFAHGGPGVRGVVDAASSAVLHRGRVVLRASSATNKLAVVVQKTGASEITAPELQLADDTPLVLDCDGETSPRFQLLELAPRAGATFDPAAAQYRVLAFLDVEAGRLVWTSRKIIPPRRAGVASMPICRHGQYFVPVELADASSALWVVGAETGTTTATFAFDRAAGSFADLEADQIDGERIVGVSRHGAYEIGWQRGAAITAPGVHDAHAELERQLGRLP